MQRIDRDYIKITSSRNMWSNSFKYVFLNKDIEIVIDNLQCHMF